MMLLVGNAAAAQNPQMNCQDSVQQNPSKIFRSGLWKEWIYWLTPGPDAYAAVQRVVAEANSARLAAGKPQLLTDPQAPIIVSVFLETNPRGLNGSSAINVPLLNEEVFFATFVTDTADGGEVFFLTDPIRSNDTLTTVKSVPGVAGSFDRSIRLDSSPNGPSVKTEWRVSSSAGDVIRFSAQYDESSVDARTFWPGPRIFFANCNLTSFSDLIYRANPTASYTLFDRDQANFIDLPKQHVDVRLSVRHHDRDIDIMFNDSRNVPVELIETDRVVRIESK